MAEWSRIESAPKDGRDVLLWFEKEDLGKYDADLIIGHWNEEIKSWTWQMRAYRGYSAAPRYWMPLPKPPFGPRVTIPKDRP